MAETVIPVTNGVNGNITDCKIETAKIKVERKGAWSLTQKETYRSYDVCTKQTINQYQTNTVTGGGFLILCVAVALVLTLFWGIIVAATDGY